MIEKIHQEKWRKAVEAHWWAVANHTIGRIFVRDYLRKNGKRDVSSLDIGCSNGKMTEYLNSFGRCVGIDLSFDAMIMCKNRGLSAAQADAVQLPFKEKSFDAVTLFDVAEHVEEHELLFREVNRVAKRDGHIFIMVPANMMLWGSHDVMYGHKRRYRASQLKDLADKTGFGIEKITYLHPFLLPIMLAFRMRDRRTPEGFGERDDFRDFGYLLNTVFEKVLILDGYIARYVSYPFGTTIFSVWRKL